MPAWAQQPHFVSLSETHGLAQRTITCGLQDQKGFLWFGSEDGLLRYDGFNFKEFRHDPTVPHSLSSNLVWFLFESKDEVLWIGTDGGGLNKFVKRTAAFGHYAANPNSSGTILTSSISGVVEDKNGILWLSNHADGFQYFDRKKNRAKLYYINYDRAINWINNKTVRIQVALDVTQLKKAEEKLRQAQKFEAVGTLAGGIAHDFNNLLMAIQGRASLMMAEAELPDILREHLASIESYTRSGAELTRQLLGLAREGKYEIRAIDLNELVQRSSQMFGRTMKEIRIEEDLEADLWTVEVDRGQIEQVLLNLYVNAGQAMPGGGTIALTTRNVHLDPIFTGPFNRNAGRYVLVSVQDTGIGMDEHVLERIFDPFYTTKGMGKGTGLGLASAYGIIQNHDGIINVQSQKGRGARFDIYLPASQKVAVETQAATEELMTGSESVLLVDDEEMIRTVGGPMLKKLGYRVYLASGGKQAVELYNTYQEKIDIVILDMIMPDMSGSETYDLLAAIDPDIKVILSSGYSIDGQANSILERGCSAFIQKPFTLLKLSKILREVLDAE